MSIFVELNLEALQIWIIIAVVGIALLGLFVFRLRKKRISGVSTGKQFLGMGIIWVLFGLGYSLWRGDSPFDIGLFNLGLIFTVAGSLQMLLGRYNRKSQ